MENGNPKKKNSEIFLKMFPQEVHEEISEFLKSEISNEI